MQSITRDQLEAAIGMDVVDSNGDKIGSVEDIYYDVDTGEPEWIGIGTGIFGLRRRVVPVSGATIESDVVRVAYDKDMVKESPTVDDDEISPEKEAEIYQYYGLTQPSAGTSSGGGTGTSSGGDALAASGVAGGTSDTGDMGDTGDMTDMGGTMAGGAEPERVRLVRLVVAQPADDPDAPAIVAEEEVDIVVIPDPAMDDTAGGDQPGREGDTPR
jgi:sporulation protein YlmC with PRC-barrel domain